MAAITISSVLLVGCVWGHVSAFRVRSRKEYSIVGGTSINITEAPFMAMYRPADEHWGCGASIINERFVLTAAHCCWSMSGISDTNFQITVGTDHALKGGKDYAIEKIFVHPKFVMGEYDYDVCVIKLTTKLTFSDRVQPVKLASKKEVLKDGDILTVIGFGETSPSKLEVEDPSNLLMKVDLPYWNYTRCRKVDNVGKHVTRNMICAGGVAGKDSCNGDSGGPLYRADGLQFGTVSWGQGCAEAGIPAVYASVPAFLDFILDVLKKNSD